MKKLAIAMMFGIGSMLGTAHAGDYENAMQAMTACDKARDGGLGAAVLEVKKQGHSFRKVSTQLELERGTLKYKVVKAVFDSDVIETERDANFAVWAACMDALL